MYLLYSLRGRTKSCKPSTCDFMWAVKNIIKNKISIGIMFLKSLHIWNKITTNPCQSGWFIGLLCVKLIILVFSAQPCVVSTLF